MKVAPIMSLAVGGIIAFLGWRVEDVSLSLSVMGTGLIIVVISGMWLDIKDKGEK